MSQEPDDLELLKTQRADGQIVLADRYRVVRELGRGGMGVVYLAEDQRLENRSTAIKMLPAVLAKNPRAIAALKKEALLAMQLSHPHIITLRGFEECDEGAFLVMDYVDGQTLETLLADKETLDEAEVVRIFAPIADALDYAHRKKVVHRDIKPSNILIAADGTPFIMDFGIAREMKDTFTRVTGKGTSGTLPYMSPEQLHGRNPTPDQDVYSLAATIYECLTGHPPFWRGAIEHQIDHDSPEPLEEASGLSAGVTCGLSKESNQRPSFCRGLVHAEVASASVAVPHARRGFREAKSNGWPQPRSQKSRWGWRPWADCRAARRRRPSLIRSLRSTGRGLHLSRPSRTASRAIGRRPPRRCSRRPATRLTASRRASTFLRTKKC